MAISFQSRKKLLPERPNVGNSPALGTASVTEVIDKYLGCNVRGDKRNINTIPDLSEQFTKAHRREINYMQLRILVTKTRPKILERFSRALFYSLNCLRVSLEALGSTVWEHICCAE